MRNMLVATVRSNSPGFVHRKCRGHEQHQQGGTGIGDELNSQPAKISAGQCRLRSYACEVARWLHV